MDHAAQEPVPGDTRVLLAQTSDAAGIEDLLRGTRFQVVALAVDGEETLFKYPRFTPDITLLDLGIPARKGSAQPGGGEVVRQIVQAHKRARIVVVHSPAESAGARAALSAGGLLLLAKPVTRASVLQALSVAKRSEPGKPLIGREHARFQTSLAVRYRGASSWFAFRSQAAITKDISSRGLALLALERLPVKTQLHLEITLPGQAVLAVEAMVLRCVPSDLPNMHLVGVHFTAIAPADAKRLNEFILACVAQGKAGF